MVARAAALSLGLLSLERGAEGLEARDRRDVVARVAVRRERRIAVAQDAAREVLRGHRTRRAVFHMSPGRRVNVYVRPSELTVGIDAAASGTSVTALLKLVEAG